MQVFYGPQAHSESSRQRLFEQLRAADVPLKALHARLLYCLDLEAAALTEAETEKLRFLLGCMDADFSAQGTALRVLPRAGTLSPWSSKATDIVHIVGLTQVRRIECGRHYLLEGGCLSEAQYAAAAGVLYDSMTEQVCANHDEFQDWWGAPPILNPPERSPCPDNSEQGLAEVNTMLGLGLSPEEIRYLASYYQGVKRTPTNTELMMFAQVNSEHCRHKIFNAEWTLDGQAQVSSLFDMVRHTHACTPQGVLVAYDDNSAVIEGAAGVRWQIDPETRQYGYCAEPLPILMKVETHNHPTAISPFSGAATGSGGEIRDEAATGRGGRPKAGLCGFSVSDLRLPHAPRAWEDNESRPAWVASPLQIMLEAPIGAARFNNEFGRPCLAGYFRTLEGCSGGQRYGYHKPIMIAGGFGNLRLTHVRKQAFAPGTPIVVLGGPAMLIGLRGGSASSQGGGKLSQALDFASVQRSNAEMQRRCQEVIEQCTALGESNPILSIHDVGAGGLSNAVPELIADAGVGGRFELRKIPNADLGMSPMEIWCNEAQERYVAAVDAAMLKQFTQMCERERCPVAVIGEATEGEQLELLDESGPGGEVISTALSALLGKAPKTHKDIHVTTCNKIVIDASDITLEAAVERVLALPAVASKAFLITIGDRSVGGLAARDQMVGPYQVPVADCAVCASDFVHYTGEAMAMGERTPVALLDAPASGRLAVAEAVTNILSADIRNLSDVRLSANWMAACGGGEDDLALFRTVQAVAEELCPALGIAIPVGKDSLSMQIAWHEGAREERVRSPLSLIVSAFAPVGDIRRTWTPTLALREDAPLLLFELSKGQRRLGGSALAQVFKLNGGPCADLDDPARLKRFSEMLAKLRERGVVLAYHDRSDGGLFVSLCEMAFAGHCGLDIEIDALDGDAVSALFCEEPGAVLQIKSEAVDEVAALAEQYALADVCFPLGCVKNNERRIRIVKQGRAWEWDLMELKHRWSETSHNIQSLRDDPDCAREELASTCGSDVSGLSATLTFELEDAPQIATGARPQVAILREQGVNGHMEMAAAFDRAGFSAVDVHMSDLLAGRASLEPFHGLAVCGGFSYGDVLGAGRGWAAAVMFHDRTHAGFKKFFERNDTFTLGVCNGCQMLSQLKTLIPGAAHFPRFDRNRSDQFEARLCMVEVMDSPSLLLRGMAGSHLPIVVAHGEGRVTFKEHAQTAAESYVCLRYADKPGCATETYPANPNGSAGGVTALCSEDGRVTVMMPHPERLFRSVQYSWHPPEWNETGPWFKLFCNARTWLDT